MNNHNIQSFITNLIILRKMNGFSQTELSEKINVSLRKYQRLEAGEAEPTLSELHDLSHALTVDIVDLIGATKKCTRTVGLQEDDVLKITNENSKKFHDFFKNYFAAKYGYLEKPIHFDEIVMDKKFLDHELPLVISNYRQCFYNKRFAQNRFNKSTEVSLFIGQTNFDHNVILRHLNYVFKMPNNYFYFDMHKEFYANKISYNGVVGGVIKSANQLYIISTQIDSSDDHVLDLLKKSNSNLI